jgi:hypothetical protein
MKDRFVFEFINEWKQLFSTYNWYSCTVCQIYFEKDDLTYGWETTMIFLGLGFRIRYNTDRALAQFALWKKEMEEEEEVV